MSFFAELKRRNVLRVGMAYVALAWLLIQVAETVFPAFGLGDPQVRMVIVALGIGLVPVLVLSWAFELTPEGLRLDRGDEAPSPFNLKTARRLDRLVMVLLALALGYFAFDKFVLDPGRDRALEEAALERGRSEALVESYGGKSIAVLPFDNMSADPEQAYFSDGIAEEILNLLAQVPELRVISRSSSFAFKGTDATIPEIADKLNVSHVLEGSVRKAGEQLRITAQLIEARTDRHLWSETYDETLRDVFDVQERIAGQVIDQLKVELLGKRPEARETDPEAWSLFLRARHLLNAGESGSIDRAEPLLKQALEIDPEYVPAWHRLGEVYFSRARDRAPAEQKAALYQQAYDTTYRVLAIDPLDPEANASVAYKLAFFDGDLEAALRPLERALANGPNDSQVLMVASAIMRRIGRSGEAVMLGERSVASDPLCVICLVALEKAYMVASRYEDALAVNDRRQSISVGGDINRARMLLLLGRPAASLEVCTSHEDDYDAAQIAACRALALHDLGRDAEARKALAVLLETATAREVDEVARVYVRLGQPEQALDYLAAHMDTEAPDFGHKFAAFVWDPLLDPLRDTPQWREWREQAGLDGERLASLEFDLPPQVSRAR